MKRHNTEESSSSKRVHLLSEERDDRVSSRISESESRPEREEEEMEWDDEEAEEIRLATQKQLKVIEEYRRNAPKVALSGVIESVTLQNFMCHGHLKVDLCPQVNFITGHNGSGKSAILTAITVCLGGKSSSTNRSTNLKGFIKEGADRAEVVVKFKNKGQEAYKHDLYGDSITIHRVLTKANSSEYKLFSDDGKLASKTKSEVTGMCDHFAIQPDNPMIILSQDAAKQFLASSTPEERYKLFLKGTQLQQLLDDYEAAHKHIKEIKSNMDTKNKVFPELKRRYDQSQQKYMKMEASVNLESTLETLNKHIAWSHVYDKKDIIDEAKAKFKDYHYVREQVDGRIATEQEKLDAIDAEILRLQEVINEYRQQGDPAKMRFNELKIQLDSLKKAGSDMVNSERSINEDIQMLKKSRDLIESKIVEEHTRENENNLSTVRANLAERIAGLERSIIQLEGEAQQRDMALQEPRLSHAELERADAELDMMRNNCRKLEQSIARDNDEMRNIGNSKNNHLAQFGPNVPQMIKEIEMLTQRGEFRGGRPVGPVGLHIKLQNQMWASTLDEAIGTSAPYAFIVQDSKDVRKLMQVFERYEYGRRGANNRVNRYHEIFVCREDPSFDYRAGLPRKDSRYFTIFDVLEINNRLVEQMLVDSFSCEGIILVEHRQTGEQLMFSKQWPQNVVACYDLNGFRIGHRGRGNATFCPRRKYDSRSTFGTVCFADEKQKIAMLNSAVNQKKQQLQEMRADIDNRHQATLKLRQEKKFLSDDRIRITSNIRNMKNQIGSLNNELEALENAAAVSILDDLFAQKRDYDTKIDTLKKQFPAILHARKDNRDKQEAIQEQMKSSRDEMLELQQKSDDFINNQNKLFQKKSQCVANLDHYKHAKSEVEAKYDAMKREVDAKDADYQVSHGAAMQICESEIVERQDLLHRSTERIESAIRETRAALEARNEQLGTVEDAHSEMLFSKDKYENAKRDITEMATLHKTLQDSLKKRKKGWFEFRTLISQQTTVYFGIQLARRDFEGHLRFDHTNEKLLVVIKTKDAEMAQQKANSANFFNIKQKKARDPRSLSGGEKSFSTVCLLMAMWNAMSSPLRGLDEFDVFMDPVNRRVAVGMLIDNARDRSTTQFILISPQAMTDLNLDPNVKVIQLEDPRKIWGSGQQIIGSDFRNTRV